MLGQVSQTSEPTDDMTGTMNMLMMMTAVLNLMQGVM